MKNKRKIFILDTSVLLYDKTSIHSFPESDVVIPVVVLDELDRFKDKQNIIGESARYVNRYLDDLRSQGRLDVGIKIEESGQTIRVETDSEKESNIPPGFDLKSGDNQIIATAIFLSKKNNDRTLKIVTKDINLRVKCDALGIMAEDYYKDRIVCDEDQIYRGYREIKIDDDEVIEKFYKSGSLSLKGLNIESNLNPNEFVILKSGSNSLLGRIQRNKIIPLFDHTLKEVNISPKNKEQKFALDLLTNEDIPLVTLTGIAGSGKTFLTLMAGLSGLYDSKYERIVITRTLQPVGKDIGYLPGDVNEKMNPWMSPVFDNLRHAFKDLSYFDLMREKGKVEIAPISLIRGRTFNNTFLIVDEAQNSTIHELKTVITRMGEGSKIVLLGDIEQIDTPYIDGLSNGLTIVVEKFKNHSIAGHVTLRKGERSLLASLASRVI